MHCEWKMKPLPSAQDPLLLAGDFFTTSFQIGEVPVWVRSLSARFRVLERQCITVSDNSKLGKVTAGRPAVWLSNNSRVIYILDLTSLVTFQSKLIRSCWKSHTSVWMNRPCINTWGWTMMWQHEQTEYLIKEREFESQIHSCVEHSRRTIQHQNKGSWSFQSRYTSRIPFNACIRSSSWNKK